MQNIQLSSDEPTALKQMSAGTEEKNKLTTDNTQVNWSKSQGIGSSNFVLIFHFNTGLSKVKPLSFTKV